jgi:translation initiation factor 2B subunit (eIF-2B alpha/beta/delta family)
MQLSKRRRQLATEKADLEEEVNSSLSPAEMRDRLLQKVKDANAEVTAAEKKQKQLTEAHDKLQDEIREREQEIVEAKVHTISMYR